MSSCFRLASVAFLVVASFATFACVDPDKTFGDFGERVVDASPVADAGGGGAFDITGSFLLSIQTSIGTQLRFVEVSTFMASGEGGTATFSLQGLVAPQCNAEMSGQPAGTPLEIEGVPVSAEGVFNVSAQDTILSPLTVPGLCDATLVADIDLVGTIRNVDLYCGTVSGMVQEPALGFTGTFAAVALEEPVMTGDENLPAPVFACP